MQKMGIALFSLILAILGELGIMFGVYLFIGVYSPYTLVTFLIRPGGIFPVWILLLVGFLACWFVAYLIAKQIAGEGRTSYRDIMISFLCYGHNPADVVGAKRGLFRGIWKKILLAFVIGWFLDLWHEAFFATPVLVGITAWYEMSLNYYGIDRQAVRKRPQ